MNCKFYIVSLILAGASMLTAGACERVDPEGTNEGPGTPLGEAQEKASLMVCCQESITCFGCGKAYCTYEWTSARNCKEVGVDVCANRYCGKPDD